MIKIPTLFKKNPENLGRAINELQCEWIYDKGVKATRKFDGMAVMFKDGALYKRYDVKPGRKPPEGAIPCQGADEVTGHWPHWIHVDAGLPENKLLIEALSHVNYDPEDGTYEFCGPKINGNKEKLSNHGFVKHGSEDLYMFLGLKATDGTFVYNFDAFKTILESEDIEGIVFHHPDGRMCKIRKSDFGIKR